MSEYEISKPYDILHGDALEQLRGLPSESVNCTVTSPPYFALRDYGVDGQIGHEQSVDEYVQRLVAVFREVRRVLTKDGSLWLNLGDSYASSWACGRRNQFGAGPAPVNVRQNRLTGGLKNKDLIGVPWSVAFALRADGWYLRSDIVWSKPNPTPESVRDRPTKSHEYVFLLTKAAKYHYDADAISEPVSEGTIKRITQRTFAAQTGGEKDYAGVDGAPSGRSARRSCVNLRGRLLPPTLDEQIDEKIRKYTDPRMLSSGPGLKGHSGNRLADGRVLMRRNKRTVWNIATRPYAGAHFATFPITLAEPCILAGCLPGGLVLDPFSGAATTGLVALRHGRRYLGIELNEEYIALAKARIDADLEKRK